MSQFSFENAEEANRGTEEALERVVTFLQQEAIIPHFGFLPYRYLLVVLTRYFAHHANPVQRNRELLRRWFWRAAIAGPSVTRGGYTSTMRTFASCIAANDESGSVQRLLRAVPSTLPMFTLPKTFRSTHAELRFALCGMWDLGPISPTSGERYSLADLSEAVAGRTTASSALELLFSRPAETRSKTANRVILLGEDLESARERFVQQPHGLSEATWNLMITSHALTEELLDLIRSGSIDNFLSLRHTYLEAITRSFVERMTEMAFEDTPPLEELDLDQDDEQDEEEASRRVE